MPSLKRAVGAAFGRRQIAPGQFSRGLRLGQAWHTSTSEASSLLQL